MTDEQGVVRQGRLKVLEVWSLPLGHRVVVPFNAQAQPVGEAAGLLSGFLGLVVTDVATFPISYHSWDKVPNSYKESCFNSIKGKFCLDRVLEKHFIIRKLGKNWRNYRCFLFGQFYQVEKTREQNLEEHSPKFIPLDMWAAFVDYRLDPKTKLEANKSQTKSFMTFVLRNLGLESVPPEFADLINPQVSDANSAEPSSTGQQSSHA
ncbi:hypothetical protein G2W53_001219 [Senna tora]|uniref:Uncharacterized protein n=1 Tax=Senna tora TaxID=362788 RepID=A0A834XFI3_9FABA|nr:hypothetical protein G2W53_001219 [Senna tora]